MKHLVFVSTFLIAAFSFAACGKKGGPGAAANLPGPVGPSASQCAPGQVFNTTYGCLDRGSCPDSQGWVPTLQRCEAGTPVSFDSVYGAPAGLRWGYPLQNIDRGVFERLMREYGGFCGQYTWNFGTADCKTYSSKGYVILQTTGAGANALNVTIGAGANAPYSIYDYWSAYTGVGNAHFPMQFRTTLAPIGGGAGFEARSQSATNWNAWNQVGGELLTVYAPASKLTDQVLKIEIFYRGAKLGDAPVERY